SPPTTQASLSGPLGSHGWYTGTVTVTLTATDPDGDSDVAATYYTVDNGAQQTYSSPFAVSHDAIHSLTFWSVDHAGNKETPNTQTIKIDGTAPSVTASANPSTLTSPNGRMVTVTVSGSMSDALSGLSPASAAFSVIDDYGTVQPSGSISVQSNGSYSFSIQLQASRNGKDKNGRHYTITVRALDMAGNAGSAITVVTVPHN
ncbi:MAG TPA: Ig-like domain repeat protein, partial [Chthonomonadaceae bacterium]|nr:Ig-like domain repeat protein [Chthonomonadaceae bacterium]